MVGNIKQIGGAFFVVLLLFLGLKSYFDATIEKKNQELKARETMLKTFHTLEHRYSRKAQSEALAKIFKMLDVFGVAYEVKEKRKRKIITLQLTRKNADRVVGLFLNSTIHIKKIKLEKQDDFRVTLHVEVV